MTDIADETRRILILEAFADQAKKIAAEGRARLGTRARDQLASEGVAPSWNLPKVAKVTLGLTSEAIEVDDPAKLLAWVQSRSPDEVVAVSKVRDTYMPVLLSQVKADEGLCVWTETGEIIPGLRIRPGGQPKGLSITPQPGVRDSLQQVVHQMLRTAHAAIAAPPPEPATADGDPFAMFPATPSGGPR